MEIFDKEYDEVVKSIYCSGKTTFKYAMKHFHPQIDKYYAQRKKQNNKFYQKLERDLKEGCIMPPITIALVLEDLTALKAGDKELIIPILDAHKDNIYILDGIQRLNTLSRAYEEGIADNTIYFNLLLSDSDDRLLYRMITLNNGQKPMSARHQIEILAYNVFDFESVSIVSQTEKDRAKKIIKGSFNRDDIIRGYIAYLGQTINIDNKKIIESKMDELIAEKIIQSDVTKNDYSYKTVIELIEKFIDVDYLHKWFKQSNNMVGFCAGIGSSYNEVNAETVEEFANNLESFEKALANFDVSKIKLGHLRRLTVNFYISKYLHLKDMSDNELFEKLSEASSLYI